MSPSDAPSNVRERRRALFERLGPIAALLLVFLGTVLAEWACLEPSQRAFLTTQNLVNVLGQWSYVGMVAVGMTFVIVLGGIDLSVGAIVALAAGTAVYAMNETYGSTQSPAASIAAAAAVCLIGGPLLGLVNGLVIGVGRIAPFIATLGTMVAFRALILAPAEGSEIRSAVSSFSELGRGGFGLPYWLGGTPPSADFDGQRVMLRWPIVAFASVALAGQLLLSCTRFGMNVYAIGDNRKAARYAGISTARTTVLVYVLAGAACGVAGLFNASRLNSVASSSLGSMYELDAIAAVVIGGTRLQGGSGRVWGTVVGVLIIGLVENMLRILGVSSFYHGLVKGLIIVAAVLVQPRGNE